MKKYLISALASLALVPAGLNAAGGGDIHIEDYDWSFEGPFGSFDKDQLQRGLQVYTEVCAACHGLQYVGFYSLDDKGGPEITEGQAREYAKGFLVWDENLRDSRDGTYSDNFPDNRDAGAPDLSLMAKARAGFHGPHGLGINQIVKGMGGPEYIFNLLTNYTGKEKEEYGALLYENKSFDGGYISMGPPLEDGLVDYNDAYEGNADIPETVEQYAADVSAFLMWTAEPNLNQRKKTGLVITSMLFVLTVLLWFTNKAIWYNVKHKKD